MAMSGIEQYGGLLNSYAYQNIQTVDVDTVKKQDEALKSADRLSESLAGLAASYENPYKVDTRSNMANLEDVALSMQTDSDFDFLGRNSSISGLDMEQAISDMQKDSVLQDYQYFVGSKSDIGTMSEDGLVIQK